MCCRHSVASVLQHVAVLLGSAVGSAGLSDCLAQRSVSGTHRHLHRPTHRALHANAAGQAGTQSGLQSTTAGGSVGTTTTMEELCHVCHGCISGVDLFLIFCLFRVMFQPERQSTFTTKNR